MAYDAFISYSHAADGRLAPALQSGLQRLAKPWYRLRALRVFRDETGLSTNPQLWSSIVAALDESEWFVLLASPESAGSPWVDREIAHWLATNSADRVLSVVTGGEWGWDSTAGRLVGDAVPERLAAALVEEPRHLDLRWAADETDLDLRNSGFRSAVADLAAPMHGIAKDELEGEDIRQHRRARRLARGAVAVVVALLIASIVFGDYAVNQRNRARAATREAELGRLVAESRALLSSERPLALLLAAEAYGQKSDVNARDAVLAAVLADPRLQRSFGPPAGVTYAGGLSGTRVAVAADPANGPPHGYGLSVWNWKTGREVPWPGAPQVGAGLACANANPVGLATSPDGDRIAVLTADGLLHMFSGPTLEAQGEPFPTGLDPFPACSAPIVFSPNGRWLAVANGSSFSNLNDKFAGKTVGLFELSRDGWRTGPTLAGHQIRVDALAFSKDNLHLATSSPAGKDSAKIPGVIVLHDVRTGNASQIIETSDNDPLSVALDWDRRWVVASTLRMPGETVYHVDKPLERTHTAGFGAVTGPFYNADWTRLAAFGKRGLELFDAASLKKISPRDIDPQTGGGPVIYLPDDQILLAGSRGPMTVWDPRGASVLQPVVSKFAVVPTSRPDVFISSKSTRQGAFVTIRGPGPEYRPLHAEIRIGARLSLDPPTVCADPHTNRIATVGTRSRAGKGDIVVRRGVLPFDVTSHTRGVVDFVPGGCAWRPDGKQIAIGGDGGEVALYQVATGHIQPVDAGLRHIALSLAYRPNSTELWVTSPGPGDSPARITNLDGTPQVSPALPNLSAISALRFTPDGRFLVTATETSVQVLNAHSLEPVTGPISAPANFLLYVSVSPDGHTAVTSDLGGGMQLVDLRAGRVIGAPIPIAAPGTFNPGVAFFGRDDTTIYAATVDGTGTVWDLAPHHVRDKACTLAGRNLTKQEWDRYLPWGGPRHATCPQYPLN